jgi:mRNA interferase MazF
MAANLHTFDDWNDKKKRLHAARPNIMFKEGQIWWCSLGVNVGEEVLGKGKMYRRPIIVLRKVTHNSCVVIPTTTQAKQGSWYFPFEINNLKRWAMMHQIRFISSRRLSSRESILPAADFQLLKKAIAEFYDL